MRLFKQLSFLFIMITALLTSGHAAYSVLYYSMDTPLILAIVAAVVIDLAAIWMGTHTAELATLGDSVTKARIATVTIIVTSLIINFMYGYTSGTWVTGLLACIYPFLAALIYEFFIEHKIREQLRQRGRILPESPVYLKSRKYQDKARVQQLHKAYAALTLDIAEDKLQERRAQIGTWLQEPLHVSATLGTRLQTEYGPELQVTTKGYKITDTVTDLGTDVDNIFAGVTDVTSFVTLPDWLDTGMNTPAICIACVSHGVTDLDTVLKYVNIINDDEVSRNTVKTNISRAKTKLSNNR